MRTEEKRSKKRLLRLGALALTVLVAIAAGCSGGGGGDGLSGSIEIAGSSTVFPVSQAMAEEFTKQHPNVEIPVQSTGTGGGFENFFIPGKTDINDASRPIKASELQKAKDNDVQPVEYRVATDALTIVVNEENTWAEDLTKEQLKQIWRPDDPAQKWSDINPEWPDEEIKLYGPTSASGTFDFFTETVVGEEDASRSDYQGTEQDNTITQAVSRDKYALGYFGLAYYLENQGKVKAVKVEGVKPSIDSAKSGDYPLSRPLFIYVNKGSLEKPEVKQFVEFYIENAATSLVSNIGYVPITDDIKQENMDNLENPTVVSK